MDTHNTALLLLTAFLLIGAFALRIWRKRGNDGGADAGVDFRPSIGFTRLDGWASLALLLENRSEVKVWAEEVEIVLANLIAEDQTSEATYREIQKIHQNVGPRDRVPVSVMETIYKAAGRPQRKYSCLMSSVVRYKAGEDWFEKPMPPHNLKLAGLTVASSRKERWNKSEFKPPSEPQGSQIVGRK